MALDDYSTSRTEIKTLRRRQISESSKSAWLAKAIQWDSVSKRSTDSSIGPPEDSVDVGLTQQTSVSEIVFPKPQG